MNYFLLCNILISIFFTTNAMDAPQQSPSIWAITPDKDLIEIEKVIAQQSNLLTVLQKKYAGTKDNPIPIPVSKASFDIFCFCLTKPAQQLLTTLTDKDYSQLMDIAEKLKCLIFYAELMEQLLQEKSLCNRFALESIKMRLLKKEIYKHFFEKKCIKKSKNNRHMPCLEYSNDGKYFLEGISNNSPNYEMNLWDTENLTCIKTFPGYTQAIFSPNSDYIILCTIEEDGINMKIPPILYSITDDISISLLDDYQNWSWYKAVIHPNGHYIIQNAHQNIGANKYMLFHYINHKNSIQEIPLENNWNDIIDLDFYPDGKHVLYLTTQGKLIKCEIHNQNNKKIIDQHLNEYNFLRLNKDASLLSLHNYQTKEIFSIKDDTIISKKKLHFYNHYHGLKELYIHPKNIYCYNPNGETLCLLDENYNQIASYQTKDASRISELLADTTGNHLVSLHRRSDAIQNAYLSTLIFWNLSDIARHIPGIKVNTQTLIHEMTFTHDGLLLTQGAKTELWEMNGDKILNLGKSTAYTQRPNTNSILTYNCIQSSREAWRHLALETKLYLSHLHTDKAQASLENIKKSLTSPQAILFNMHYEHRRDKKRTKLYPNMPDGRALESFKKEHKFLIKNFKLDKQNFIPKIQLISQPETLPHEQS